MAPPAETAATAGSDWCDDPVVVAVTGLLPPPLTLFQDPLPLLPTEDVVTAVDPPP